jgi:hypothetical protein
MARHGQTVVGVQRPVHRPGHSGGQPGAGRTWPVGTPLRVTAVRGLERRHSRQDRVRSGPVAGSDPDGHDGVRGRDPLARRAGGAQGVGQRVVYLLPGSTALVRAGPSRPDGRRGQVADRAVGPVGSAHGAGVGSVEYPPAPTRGSGATSHQRVVEGHRGLSLLVAFALAVGFRLAGGFPGALRAGSRRRRSPRTDWPKGTSVSGSPCRRPTRSVRWPMRFDEWWRD